ncbi:MAG: CRISPR-associated primase-polymerase type A1 [bacterium]
MSDLFNNFCEYSNLNAAFRRVSESGGGPGADHVTIEKYASEIDKNIHMLIDEIKTSSYFPKPIAKFKYKAPNSDKVRILGIPSVKDRVVHVGLLNVIEPVFEKEFLRCSYGYRPHKSALQAVIKTEKYCKDNSVNFAFNADIHSFFDSINIKILTEQISKNIKEKPLLNVIFLIIQNSSDGKETGITLGAPTSPIFGNIYLNDFDKTIFNKANSKYLRYADDFVIFSDSEENIQKLKDISVNYLKENLILELSKEKSSIVNIDNKGFDFLGYHFNRGGKYPSEKSLRNFSEKINGLTLNSIKNIYLDSIIEGWLNYFDIKIVNKDNYQEIIDVIDKLITQKPELNIGLSILKSALFAKNFQKDISSFIIKSVKNKILSDDAETLNQKYKRDVNLDAAILTNELDLEKDSFDFIAEKTGDKDRILKICDYFVSKSEYEKAVRLLNRFIENNPEFNDGYEKLSDIYSKMGLIGLANKMKEYKYNDNFSNNHNNNNDNKNENENEKNVNDGLIKDNSKKFNKEFADNKKDNSDNEKQVENRDNEFNYKNQKVINLNNNEIASKFLNIFIGADNYYAKASIDDNQKLYYSKINEPLDDNAVLSHINGICTLGEYIIRNDNCINFAVIDIDIASEYIKRVSINSEEYNDYLNEALMYCTFIKNSLKEKTDSECYIEFSGYKGYHVWFFFDKPILAKVGRGFVNYFINEHKFRPHINIEIFPKENKINQNASGSLIKLPLGINKLTGAETYFVDDKGDRITNQFKFIINDIKKISESSINYILNHKDNRYKNTELTLDDIENEELNILLDNCSVLKYLYDKVKITKYLTHTERLSILYSIGYAYNGKKLVHYIISYCANYDKNTTQKYINKVKGDRYSISCYKIREWLSYITSQVGCNCKFKLEKGEYPNILLYLKEFNKKIDESKNDLKINQTINQTIDKTINKIESDILKSNKSDVIKDIHNSNNDNNKNNNDNSKNNDDNIDNNLHINNVNNNINGLNNINDKNNIIKTVESKNNNDIPAEITKNFEVESFSADKLNKLIIEFLINKKELSQKIESFNKTKENIDKIFEELEIDSLNTEYGILRKINKNNAIKYIIEI